MISESVRSTAGNDGRRRSKSAPLMSARSPGYVATICNGKRPKISASHRRRSRCTIARLAAMRSPWATIHSKARNCIVVNGSSIVASGFAPKSFRRARAKRPRDDVDVFENGSRVNSAALALRVVA